MSKKIIEIPFWAIFYDCFPNKIEKYNEQNESAITADEWLTIARWWRNVLLNESDWSQVSDNSLSEIQRESWRQYRQELRDITVSFANPKDIIFPDIPAY
jgi:hypothetical protein